MQHKFKFLAIATFLIFSFCAKAQNTTFVSQETPQYIGKKCPDCTVENLEKWKYTKDDTSFTETIESPDVNAYAIINWKDLTVTTPDGVYKIAKYETSATEPKVTVWYASQSVVLFYNRFSQYTGHKISSH